MQLIENLPENENLEVFFDNYFTGIPLLLELKKRGKCALGVVKSNRMSGTILKSKKDLKKEGRGAMDSRVSKSGKVAIVRWHDNNDVNAASTFIGIGEVDKVKRWCKK